MPDETMQEQTQQPIQSQQQTVQNPAPQQYQQPVDQQAASPIQSKGTSGLSITSLVLGILAILTSFLPIINNGSFFLALLGLIFAIAGFIATGKGKKSGRGLAIAGLVLNILSIAIVLFTQSMYSAAIDSAVEELESGSKPVAAATAQTSATAPESAKETADDAASEQEAAAAPEEDFSNLAIGEGVTFENGLSVSVDGVITGLSNYNDEPVTGVTVTYANNGDKNQAFNPYDWKAQDVNGVLDSQTFFIEGENGLSSGELTPGSSITGNIYFDGELAKIYYYDNIFQSDSQVAWNLQ